MEVSGTVLRRTTYISGVGTHTRSHGVVPRRVRVSMGSGFHDEGHVQYYQDVKKKTETVIISNKKKMKLLKRLSKNASELPQLGFAQHPNLPNLLGQLHQSLAMQDGGEELLRELEKVRAGEKELKKKMKQEKKKAKLKPSKMKTCNKSESSSSSSSESESSDSDCDVATKPVDELELKQKQPMLSIPEDSTSHHHVMDVCTTNNASLVTGFNKETNVVIPAAQKRIEVCMGNKCKKSGAATLLQEFEKVVGVEGEGVVVGCKCMGKCKTAPNVRIQNSVDLNMVQGIDDSVKIPSNPLCIGVGLEDVDTIVARFLGEDYKDVGTVAATSS